VPMVPLVPQSLVVALFPDGLLQGFTVE
jgi:hypothetical protein